MKPTLKRIMVSGIFTLLVTFTFTQNASAKPAGYTSDGQPYYYAYPDEGYAEPTPAPPMEPNPYAYNYAGDESGYNEPYVDYYDAPWGWWGWGWGWPIGFGDGFNFDFKRHHGFHNRFHNNGFFARHNGFNQKSFGHSAIVGNSVVGGRSAATPHQSVVGSRSAMVPHQSAVGNRTAGAGVSRGGRGFSGGGGRHR